MTKRILALFLVCILAVPLLVVPASATTEQQILGEVQSQNNLITSLHNTMVQWFDAIDTRLETGFQAMAYWFQETLDVLDSDGDGIGDLKELIYPALTDIYNAILQVQTGIYGFRQDIKGLLDSDGDGTSDLIEFVTPAIDDVRNAINTASTNIQNAISAMSSALQNKLDTLITGSSEGQSAADDLNDDLAQQETQMNEMVDAMATAPTVDDTRVDNALGEVGSMYDSADRTYLNFFVSVLSRSLFADFFLYAALMALVGYILFGRR